MKQFVRSVLFAGLLSMVPAAAWADPLNLAGVKSLVEGMGYESSEIKNDDGLVTKLEITLQSGDLTVPIGLEVSPSTRYVWCTIFFGPAGHIDGTKALEILKRQGGVQPSHFWITAQNELKLGIAVDNREITPVSFRYVLEKLAADTANTIDLWDAS